MTADSIPLEQIHDLAANYSDRQGLRIIPMAVAMMALAFPRELPASILGIDTQLGALAIGFAGYWLIGRYYERRFGKVEEIPYEGFPIAGQILLVVIGFFVSVAIDIVARPPVFVSGLVVAAWLIVTSWPSRRIRGEYQSIGTLLILVSLAPLVGVPQATVAKTYCFWFGFGLLLAGVRDHISFVRSLPALRHLDE